MRTKLICLSLLSLVAVGGCTTMERSQQADRAQNYSTLTNLYAVFTYPYYDFSDKPGPYGYFGAYGTGSQALR